MKARLRGTKEAGRYSPVSCRTGFRTLPGRAIGYGRRSICRPLRPPGCRETRRRPAGGDPGPRGPGRAGRARHLPQPRERLLRAPDQGAGTSRPGHCGGSCRDGGARGMDHRLRGVGQRPHPRPAVQGALHAHLRTVLGRGHREVSRLRHDPGHRPGLCPQAGPDVRREGFRRDRGRAGAAARGDRHRPGAGEADHRCLGRAEGCSRDHGVPAQPRRGHGAGGADIPDLRAPTPWR